MTSLHLSLREKIGQLFMVGFPGSSPDRETLRFLTESAIGFIILFHRNFESLEQTRQLTQLLHGLSVPRPLIFTDQEGGTVVQFGEQAATGVSAMGLRATGDPENARRAAWIIGVEMDRLGLDGVLAPILDVNEKADNPIIGIRAFSDKPREVALWGTHFFNGLRESGILACGKHFPGHGSTGEDSHLTVPQVRMPADRFTTLCLAPFSVLCDEGIDALMTAHVTFPVISPDIATFSADLIDGVLRARWRYQGVVISDCLEMAAVADHHSTDTILQSALRAGVDVLTVSHRLAFQRELVDRLVRLVESGQIPESRIDESLTRILALKANRSERARNRHREPLSVRPYLDEEQRIADQSITLVSYKADLLPIPPEARILLIEFPKIKASQSLEKAENISWCQPLARDYFPRAEIRMLGFDDDAAAGIADDIRSFDRVIVMVYSRNSRVAERHARVVRGLLRVRPDLIVAAVGNPYDIRHYPSVPVYLATYGFRRIQLESFFRVLKGVIKPRGELPVSIDTVV